MNLDQFTYGQLKEIAALFSNEEPKSPQKSILAEALGKYCIVRTRNEGINFGKVVAADETGVVIEEARRIYYHRPKNNNVSWYEGVAATGLHSDSKISGEVERKYIIEDYSLTLCSGEAIQSIKEHVATGS